MLSLYQARGTRRTPHMAYLFYCLALLAGGELRRMSLPRTSVNKGKKKGRDRRGFAPSSLLGRLKNPSHRGGGCYVLVDAEEVGRIILVLYLDQTLEVVAVGCFDAFLALVHHEVYIRPAA